MKERIQHKAAELFKRYGIRSVTMDEIATQLGISKKTIYQYYSDKGALVKDIFNDIIGQNKQKCTQFRCGAENAIHEQYLAAEMSHEIFNNMNSAMLFDLSKFHPDIFAELEKFKKHFLFNVIKDNLQRGVKEGFFRKDMNVDIITWLRLDMISGLFFNEEVLSGKTKPEQFEIEMRDFFFHGICTEKGINMLNKYKHQRQKKSV